MLAAPLKPLLRHPAAIAMETTIDDPALDRAADAENEQPLGTPLTGHEAGVASVAFSPDGKRCTETLV